MKYLLPGWVHNPGVHCASTAISDALTFHGHGLTEAMCFGLGCGLGFAYLESPLVSPSRLIAVRSRLLETRCFENLGRPFRWQTDPDPPRALAAAKLYLQDNLPLLLRADICHLPYYNSNTHFPGHVIGMWGFDDEKGVALIADTGWEGLQEVPYAELNLARYDGTAAMKISGDCFPVAAGQPAADWKTVLDRALVRQALDLRGLELELPGIFGFAGMKSAAAAMPEWGAAADWQWCARWFYQVIERRGTGGGAFRLLYSRFLAEIRERFPAYEEIAPSAEMEKIAALWTELSRQLKAVSEAERPDGLPAAARRFTEIIEREEDFFAQVLRGLDRPAG